MKEFEDGRREKMKVVSRSIVQNHASAALAVLAFLVAIPPSVSAKHRAVKPAPQPATVIAHLALPGASVNQLVLQEHGSKQYLYIEQASKEGFAIVDVTKPNQPSVIKSEAWPNEASTGKLQMVGVGLALVRAPDVAATETVSRTETLKVLDLSDPTNPRTILSFSGVTSTLADDARNLVYITNRDGLWILKHQPEQATYSEPRGCLPEDAFNELASCQ
jgi:hypothetical protein